MPVFIKIGAVTVRKSALFADSVPFRSAPRPYARRRVRAVFDSLTCLVLIRHGETDKALQVSDDGEAAGAVWVPKALLSIDRADRGRFLVATMSQALAQQKRLTSRFIDPSKLLPEEAERLADAVGTARSRNALRGYRQPIGWSGGRNVFA
jgi:hypothetical protein